MYSRPEILRYLLTNSLVISRSILLVICTFYSTKE